MEVCVQIIDINPAISYLKTNKSDIISLILFDDETSEVIINLDKFIQKKDTLNFVIKNINNNNTIKIKCTLVLNIKDILGVSEFLPKPNGIDLIQVNFVTNITEGNKITQQIYIHPHIRGVYVNARIHVTLCSRFIPTYVGFMETNNETFVPLFGSSPHTWGLY